MIRGPQASNFPGDALERCSVKVRQGFDSSKLKCLMGLLLEVASWCVKDLGLSP